MNWESFTVGALSTIFILFLLAIAFYNTTQQPSIATSASGTINTTLTTYPSHVDWGTVTIGIPVTRNITFTNNGSPWQSLNMTYGNHTVNLLNYTLTWDAEGLSLSTANTLTANFTLTIHKANITDTNQFTIDITISENP